MEDATESTGPLQTRQQRQSAKNATEEEMPKGDDKRADATSAGSDSKAERKAKGQGPSGAVGQSSASRKSEPAHGNAWAWVTTRTGLPMPAVAGVAGALVMLALLLAWFLLLRPRAAITAVFAIPAYKGVLDTEVVRSILACYDEFNRPKSDIHVSVMTVDDVPDVALARGILVTRFLKETQADYMVFVDNDITFPAWLVRKFLTAGFDAATAACPKRMIDWEKVTRMVGRGFTAEDLDRGVASITNFDFLPDLEETRRRNLPDGFYVADKALKRADGWLQIARAGTGFLVLSRRLLLAMVRQYPELTIQHPTYGEVYALFQQRVAFQTPTAALKDHVGEDWVFADRAREMGFDIWLDTTYGLKHTGEYHIPRYEGSVDQPAAWYLLASGQVPGVDPPAESPAEVERHRKRMEALAKYLEETRPFGEEALARLRAGEAFESVARDITPRLRAWKQSRDGTGAGAALGGPGAGEGERTGDGDAGLVDGRVEGNQEGNPEGQGGMGGAALPQPAGSPFHLHSRSGGLRVMELL